jgi:hypothetical protein
MKKIVIICLFLLPKLLGAQLQDKFQYINTRSKSLSFGAATMAAFFFKDYDLENDIKVRGIDDSLRADNIIKVELTHDTIFLYNIYGMSIPDSFNSIFYGTFYVRNYKLTSEEINKKMIVKTDQNGNNQLTKVQYDSSGRAYYKDWKNLASVLISNSEIKSVIIRNSNFWANSQEEKKKMINRFQRNQAIIGAAGILIVLTGLTWALGVI